MVPQFRIRGVSGRVGSSIAKRLFLPWPSSVEFVENLYNSIGYAIYSPVPEVGSFFSIARRPGGFVYAIQSSRGDFSRLHSGFVFAPRRDLRSFAKRSGQLSALPPNGFVFRFATSSPWAYSSGDSG